ncbi:leukotriene C4 synthase isoform X4 [Ovis canadensis]|uniref:leukotriene C4 synthase isoform X4 n=1 Tax=Ovis canadensis TaxID=37174 RepID=UPI00374FE72E
MKDEAALLATVTLLGVLLQAYFSLQVISARRAFRVSPPLTTGPPEFERIYRAQVNCSEYFPLFLATLWVAGIFFHEGLDVGEGRAHRSRGVPAAAGSPQPAPPPPPLPRRGGTVRSGLPVRAPPLLPGLRALCAAEAGPAVRERARALASRGPGGPRPARPLPPGRAARHAPWTAPETAAEGLRQRTPGRRSCS